MARTQEEIFTELDRIGRTEATARVMHREFDEDEMPAVDRWMLRAEGLDRDRRDNQIERTIDAANRSADAAKLSARFSMFAAVIALVTVGVSVLKGCSDEAKATPPAASSRS